VQKGVELAVNGDLSGAAEVFAECIMCNLCTLACPERIRPNHLGLFLRRATTAMSLRPVDLMQRLQEIETGAATIDVDAVDVEPTP
jgi:Fe-S oxidoreductase